ncbi:MAG TPA: KEOPS complex subunit Cgi121 [Thermoplasmata archaeon]|jgi:KEOPS complex subunit Cgi121
MSHSIAGARGRVEDPEGVLRRARDWASPIGTEVLLADARIVFGRDHLESAVLHAERARATGRMTSRTLPNEVLRYLAAQRQVANALRVGGLRKGTEAVAVAILGPGSVDELIAHLGWERDDAVLAPEGKSLRVLGISRTEERTVTGSRKVDLALEKVALLDVLG